MNINEFKEKIAKESTPEVKFYVTSTGKVTEIWLEGIEVDGTTSKEILVAMRDTDKLQYMLNLPFLVGTYRVTQSKLTRLKNIINEYMKTPFKERWNIYNE